METVLIYLNKVEFHILLLYLLYKQSLTFVEVLFGKNIGDWFLKMMCHIDNYGRVNTRIKTAGDHINSTSSL